MRRSSGRVSGRSPSLPSPSSPPWWRRSERRCCSASSATTEWRRRARRPRLCRARRAAGSTKPAPRAHDQAGPRPARHRAPLHVRSRRGWSPMDLGMLLGAGAAPLVATPCLSPTRALDDIRRGSVATRSARCASRGRVRPGIRPTGAGRDGDADDRCAGGGGHLRPPAHGCLRAPAAAQTPARRSGSQRRRNCARPSG